MYLANRFTKHTANNLGASNIQGLGRSLRESTWNRTLDCLGELKGKKITPHRPLGWKLY
ncbi:hypothetical protein BDF14DRAFT_1749537 [Spinellus fusiger]|nr:hypothetical protein BDF14DRAFT_1749537 [Spinellus fusiger]